jgi:hypothetical protein
MLIWDGVTSGAEVAFEVFDEATRKRSVCQENWRFDAIASGASFMMRGLSIGPGARQAGMSGNKYV